MNLTEHTENDWSRRDANMPSHTRMCVSVFGINSHSGSYNQYSHIKQMEHNNGETTRNNAKALASEEMPIQTYIC